VQTLRHVLIGDGESPHLLKWARALAAPEHRLELWAVSSRGFLPGFDAVLRQDRRLALGTAPATGGGNVAVLATLPRLVRWLRSVDADLLHAHYLSSHGTLAWAARRLGGLRAVLLASAWGSDILVAPDRSATVRWLTRCVLTASALCTSDSQHMAERMRGLGARQTMVFPFGLEALPDPAGPEKEPGLWFANRGLEPIYRPERVLRFFARHAGSADRLVVAHDGSLRPTLEVLARELGIAARTQFVGRLEAAVQAGWYRRAQWYLSLPESDSVAVSVLEAMAHGCVSILSDLPANRELVRDGDNGLIVPEADPDPGSIAPRLSALAARADDIAETNHRWVAEHALFAPAVARFVERVRQLPPRRR
jgi:glycosyltransferase involved in cell wall biosynthesis